MNVSYSVAIFVNWENSPEDTDDSAGPVAEEPTNMDFSMPWSFAEMPLGTIEQWFDSI